MQKKPLRILLFNVGYATALDGTLRDYLLRFYRYLYTPRRIIRRVRQAVFHLMQSKKPDVCCFVEIHKEHGFLRHPRAYREESIENKYGLHSLLRLLPFFRDNCNGFFAKKKLPFREHYLRNGTKKLVYEIALRPDASLLLAHFSLNRAVRQEQCAELRTLIGKRRNVILCGDFNIFGGFDELKRFADSCNLRIVNAPSQATFPAVHPRKALDLFLCPKDAGHPSVTVLDSVHVSDHLPVMLEVII